MGGGPAVRGEVLTGGGPVEAVRRDDAAGAVEDPTQDVALVVDQPDEPAERVVLVHVHRAPAGVGHHGPVAGVVGEGGLAAERRHLDQDPALVVEGVAAQPHPVGVPHLHDAPRPVDLVAPGPGTRSLRTRSPASS